MTKSKHLALAFLFGAVLVGGALGFTADRMLIRDRICADKSPSLRATLAERLHLDSQQQVRLDSILDERHRRYAAVMATVRGQLDSIKLHARDQIRSMLNEQQRQEFEKLLVELGDPNPSRDDD
jgi:hypothetical protein